MHDDDFDALARAVDERLLALPPGLDPARMFGLRCRPDGFVLVPFWSGVAREIPARLVPPDGCDALALETTGWAAPLEGEVDDRGYVGAGYVRPSQHPQRRRVHHTLLVYGAAGTDVSILRYGDDEPQVLRGGVGAVLDSVRECWARGRVRRLAS
jgi:hypothetical protein